MQTIKTAVVVVLLLGVCYGAYVALNAPEPTLPDTLQDWNEDALALDVENGAAVDIPQLSQTPSPDALDSLAPPTMVPPAPAGPTPPTTPGLSLPKAPPNFSSNSSGTTPAVLVPPPLNKSNGSDSQKGLGNDIPDLPNLALPSEAGSVKEGDSIPLPMLSEPSSTLSTPAALASTPKLGNDVASNAASNADPAFPSMPSLSGLDSEPAAPEASTTGASPTSPGLLASSGNNGLPTPANGLGITKPENTKSLGSTAQPFSLAREQALKLANDGKLREALAMMSPYFNHIELTHQEHLDLKDLLDALAGEVIYSRRHLLESKFIVSAGDTLESIANKYHVSPEVLANINRMGDSKVVLAGTEMKVLNGPFRGEVSLNKGELTLFLGDLYAGRFPVSIGREPAPTEGSFSIVERRRDQAYVGPDSKYIPASDSRNPYGGYWMHLGNNFCIHGSPETSTPETESAGCISLAPLDAKEVYSLLTQGAEVVIKR